MLSDLLFAFDRTGSRTFCAEESNAAVRTTFGSLVAGGVIYAGRRVDVSLLVRAVKCRSCELAAIGVGSAELKRARFLGSNSGAAVGQEHINPLAPELFFFNFNTPSM